MTMGDARDKQQVSTVDEVSGQGASILRALCAALLASVLGVASVLVASVPANAAIDQGFTYDELNGTAVVTGCDGECPTTLVIPSTLGGLPVSRIAPSAFAQKNLTAVTLPEGLTTIWDLAFAGNDLTTLSIPATVTEIKDRAFYLNSVYELVFVQGSQLSAIGESAFGSNALTNVTLPDGVILIGDAAFADNGLTNVTLPSDLNSIGEGAFFGNAISSVIFPQGVTSIGASAFHGNALTSVTLPDGVTSIEDYAFSDNQLSSVTLPEGLTSIGESAFESNALSNAVLPDGVTSIGARSFQGNVLSNLELPDGVTSIGGSAFQGNSLTDVVVPVAVNFLGPDAFASNPNLDSVRFLGGKPNTLGARLFDDTGAEPIYVPGGATPSWAGTQPLSGREVVVVPTPVITSQPANQTLPVGGAVELSVTVDPDIPEQGPVTYAWFKGVAQVSGDNGADTFTANSTGIYHVVVSSWAGSTSSVNATVSAPVVPPKPAPKPKPVAKKKQSAKVKLPSKLKRNKTYKLPKKTTQGVALTWKVKGAGKCKINKKKATIKCRTATGKKHFVLTGAAKATSTLNAYKTAIKRRVR